ncbi:MAG TPA: amino acid carrier protein, partial [Gammaproteobacteria bacterium]|nr:amino acid carrier protein [Gammaproteobacteria bacterium]
LRVRRRARRVIAESIQNIANALFMPWVVAVLLGTGLFLTVRLRFVQFRRFGDAVRAMLARQAPGAGGVLTPFQAFMTALGASVGTGNIAGVATAIISGGPGALFWIWVYGLVATAIKFSEAVLAIEFRRVDGAQVQSGPMYYLRDGLKSPALAWVYALLAGVGALTTTPFTQPNSIAVAINAVFGVPTWIVGIVVALLVAAVILGGIRSIGRAAEAVAPLKVGLYLVGGLVVIVTFADRLPHVLSLVVSEALSPRSALGFGLFVAMRYGIARSVYASEAGYGTAAVAYGTAKTSDPAQQGLQAVMEVFIISFVTTTLSALTILVSGVAEEAIAARQAGNAFLTSTAAVAAAFDAAVPSVGGWVVAFCVLLFGYTTLTGWAYYGEQFLEYLFGRRIVRPYRWVYCLLIPLGAVLAPEVVWAWGDLMNALQIFPNVIGLIGLSAIAAKYATSRAR